MSCRHDLALGTCKECYPKSGTIVPEDDGDSLDGPGAVGRDGIELPLPVYDKSGEEKDVSTHPFPVLIFGEWRVFSDRSVRHNGNEILTPEGGVTRQIDGALVIMAAKVREAAVELDHSLNCLQYTNHLPISIDISIQDTALAREQKLQDENQALRDQVELLERQLVRLPLIDY